MVSKKEWMQGTLMLASPLHPLPASFPLPNTRTVQAMIGSYLPVQLGTMLCRKASYALCEMETEHSLKDGLILTTGAVSRDEQEDKRRTACLRYMQVVPIDQAIERACQAVPAGGESEHQLGWAVDVELTGTVSMGPKDALLRNDKGKWLADNMWRYGFIRRYGNETEEGSCEGIHLRCVGKTHAAIIHETGWTLEEYWAILRKSGALTLKKDGLDAAYLICAPCNGDWRAALPKGSACAFSGDNAGWCAACVELP